MTHTRCLIIGSGPAGYTAGIYTGRADLNPLLYEGIQPGGQLTITTEIENFPGYPEGISGTAMMADLRKQAERFGTEIRKGTIDVSACATCDGFFYKNMDVAVVGGGDTACEEATYLATLCRKVYQIVRRDELRASKAMQHKVLSNPKIEVLWNSVTQDIIGNDMDGVVGADLKNVKTGEIKHIDIAGFFVAIGHQPNTAFLKGQLELDEAGYIKVQNPSSATSIPGVFAAGDVCDPNYRQACVAAAKGCVAGIDVERFLHS